MRTRSSFLAIATVRVTQVTSDPAAMMAAVTSSGQRPAEKNDSDGLRDEAGGQRRHAPLLGHDAAEILREAERAAEDADIGGERGKQRAGPAEPGQAGGIAERHQEQRVGDAVRKPCSYPWHFSRARSAVSSMNSGSPSVLLC